ncbi:DUF106 domain-containing protein [Candidatus Pacearchaeota archaeon]|nr:DUF106 domain-containing protein [Candidatus Pacearchaeota archaeon]
MIQEWMTAHPKTSVMVIGFFVVFVMTIVQKYFTDQKRLKELKARQKEIQKKTSEKKGDVEAYQKAQKESMQETFQISMEMMKHSFKPLLITFLPILLLIWWLKGVYVGTPIESSWIWWYLISAVASSIVLRKVLDVA